MAYRNISSASGGVAPPHIWGRYRCVNECPSHINLSPARITDYSHSSLYLQVSGGGEIVGRQTGTNPGPGALHSQNWAVQLTGSADTGSAPASIPKAMRLRTAKPPMTLFRIFRTIFILPGVSVNRQGTPICWPPLGQYSGTFPYDVDKSGRTIADFGLGDLVMGKKGMVGWLGSIAPRRSRWSKRLPRAPSRSPTGRKLQAPSCIK
jgi:hypothetical protein